MKLIFTICGIILAIMLIMQAFTGKNNKNSKSELQKLIEDGAYLVDVRTIEEYNESYVKGSINIPLDSIEDNINSFKNKKHIVVFCRSGNRSQAAKEFLEKNGIQNITNGGSWLDILKITESKTK